MAVLVGLLALPAGAVAAGPAGTLPAARPGRAMRTIHYHGLRLTVPAAWPVLRLGRDSRVCVRFDRHAVYLGTPGASQACPAQPAGRTEAILVTPASYRGALLAPVSRRAAQDGAGSMLRLHDRADHLVITATWGEHPGVIRAALHLRSLRQAALATDAHAPRPVPAPVLLRRPHTTSSASPALPGEPYTGLGFDVCTTPSASAMAAWSASSPYGAIGIYIGGVNAACLGGNLTPSWVSSESAAGWHMIPIYVGLQAPGNSCGCQALSTVQTNGQYATAAAQGTAAAQDAVTQAQALGIGPGNPIYYDMEGYARSSTTSGAVLAFLQAWTQQLHLSDYYSGVYSSGSSGITDLVDNYGSTYVEPDEIWTGDWTCSPSAPPPTSPANAYVPAADWPGAHQLLQYYSDGPGCGNAAESYGGVAISVDRDFVDAPTAAYGSGTFVGAVVTTPAVSVTPRYDGSTDLSLSWPGQVGLTQYAVLAGPSPTALSEVATAPADAASVRVKLLDAYAYYAVQGLDSLGQVMGTSPPVQTAASVALFGHSAYVGARGPVGIPVACLNATTPCQVQAQIFVGKRRIAHSGLDSIPAQGGQLLVPLSARTRGLVLYARQHRLPVRVTLQSSTGATATRPLELIPYLTSGPAPKRRLWPSSSVQVIGQNSYVGNGWTGGILVACRQQTPCVARANVTLGGVRLAFPRTGTVGAGEVGYLTYRLTNHAHELLSEARGNQLGARVSITDGSNHTMALVSLVGYR
jgi:hypothetical protein